MTFDLAGTLRSLPPQIDEFESKSDSECGDGCRDSALCRFYTYFTESGNCLLFNTCHIDEEVCQGCFTSERDCQTPGWKRISEI